MIKVFGMKDLEDIIDNIRTYKEFIDNITEKINKTYGYVTYHVLYDGEIKELAFPILGKSVFPSIYSDSTQEIESVIIILNKTNNQDSYDEKLGIRRNDIYENKKKGSKIPESIFIYNSNGEIEGKLVEARPYIKNVEEHMKGLENVLNKNLLYKIYIPTILYIPVIYLTEYNRFFPSILYISKPYYQDTPYFFDNYYSSDKIYKFAEFFNNSSKTLIKPDENLLSVLMILEIVKYPTLEPYMLNLPYTFELEKSNLGSLNLELDFDEVKYRSKKALKDIFEVIYNLKLKPADSGPEDIAMGKENPIFIDIGGGFEIPLNKSGLKYILAEALLEIIEGLYSSPLLKMCEKKDNKLICNPHVKNPVNVKELIDLPNEIYYMLFTRGINEELINKLGKYDVIGKYLDYSDSLSNDEFNLMRRYLLKVVKSYNNFPVDDYIKYHK